jgi:hypothetical protein
MQIVDLWKRLLPRLREQVSNGSLTIVGIAEFCNVGTKAVEGWIAEKRDVTGERLIRLWFLLALSGSASPEIDKMPRLNATLAELYAFNVISIDEVQLYSGLKAVSGGNIYQTLRGMPLMNPQVTVDELETDFGQKLAQAKQLIKETLIKEVLPQEVPPVEPSEVTPAPSVEPLDAATSETAPLDETPQAPVAPTVEHLPYSSDAKLSLASLLGAAAPLAKHLNSKAVTAEERSAFRELISTEVLFDLSNTLNALCSERAREMAR